MTTGRRSRPTRARDLYLASALLPFAPAAASILVGWERGAWPLTISLVRGLTPDALLYSAACVVVAAPLAGVAVASSRGEAATGARRSVAQDIWRLAVATIVFCGVSAALTAARLGPSSETLHFVWTSHAVLASVTLALAALGALLGSLFRDPLDAAACGLVIAVTAGYGLLVAGAPVAAASPALLRAALLASPVMSIASAAHVDLVRSDIWYQISPLAHVQVIYPTWSAVCASYLLAGCLGFLGMVWHRTGRGGAAPMERGL
jgi:hypothetical protein